MLDTIDQVDATFNLSTGILTSMKTLATEAAATLGYRPRVVGLTDEPEGVFARGGDTTKQADVGILPTISLSEGVHRMMEHLDRRGP